MSQDERPKRHYRLVLNGKHAGSAELRQGVEDLRGKGHEVEVRVTWEAGDAERITREAVEAGVDAVVACGGDGTVNAVAGVLSAADRERRPALGVVPLGTANDFASACGIPVEMPRAVQRLPAYTPRAIDIGRVGDRSFINVATGGFGTRVTSETPDELKRALGGAAYFLTGLSRFSSIKPVTATLRGPDFEWSGELLVLAVGNGCQAGGGHRLCPDALLDDGLLDVSILPPPPEGEFRQALISLMSNGADAVRDAMERTRLPWLEIEAPDGLHLNLDGEPLSGDRFRFELDPGAIRLLLPDGTTVLRKD